MTMRMIFALVAAVSLPVSVTANPLPWAKVGFYGDTEGTVHAVYDSAPGQLVIYVVLRNYSPTDGAGTVRFSAEPPPCFDAVHLSESSVYNVMGDSQAGAWVWPLNCSDGVYLLMTIVYTVQGETWDCCWFEPQPFPGDSQVLAGDCAFTRLEWIATEGIWINPNNPMTCTSPVEETTWGAIKAMYR